MLAQVSVQAQISLKDKTVVAQVLSWDMAQTVRAEEIEAFKMEGDFLVVALSGGRQTMIHKEQFREIKNAIALQFQEQQQPEPAVLPAVAPVFVATKPAQPVYVAQKAFKRQPFKIRLVRFNFSKAYRIA